MRRYSGLILKDWPTTGHEGFTNQESLWLLEEEVLTPLVWNKLQWQAQTLKQRTSFKPQNTCVLCYPARFCVNLSAYHYDVWLVFRHSPQPKQKAGSASGSASVMCLHTCSCLFQQASWQEACANSSRTVNLAKLRLLVAGLCGRARACGILGREVGVAGNLAHGADTTRLSSYIIQTFPPLHL